MLLDVVLGQRERFEDWLEMGRDLVRRGLRAPTLVVTDGAPGLIRAMEELWPDSDRQRCTVHRWRNVAGKLPKNDIRLHERVKAAYWAALDEAASPPDAEARLRRLVTDLERPYPSAAACLAEDLPALGVHLEYPLRLRRRLRSTHLLERSLEEVKRRTKVIGRFPRRDELPEPVLGRARPVHRQRSWARPDGAGAPTAGADARRPNRPDARVADRIRCR